MAAKVFKRHELKYFTTSEQYQTICNECSGFMIPDDYCRDGGSYMIYNLYFDTPDDQVIRHSLDKPYYKEKLRLRSYGMLANGDGQVFLELKKKIGGIVAKRRAVMSYAEALHFVVSGMEPETDNYQDKQVNQEIADFINRYPVIPKVYISYERMAYYHREDHEFRISFDRGILTRRNDVNLMSRDYGTELLLDDRYLMEIKCAGAIPLDLCRILSNQKLYKTSFSKYGTEFKKFIVNGAGYRVS